jgi:hypothetical protein
METHGRWSQQKRKIAEKMARCRGFDAVRRVPKSRANDRRNDYNRTASQRMTQPRDGSSNRSGLQ